MTTYSEASHNILLYVEIFSFKVAIMALVVGEPGQSNEHYELQSWQRQEWLDDPDLAVNIMATIREVYTHPKAALARYGEVYRSLVWERKNASGSTFS